MAKVPRQVSEYMREIGARGGRAPAAGPRGFAALPPAERKRIAKAGVAARRKPPAKKKT